MCGYCLSVTILNAPTPDTLKYPKTDPKSVLQRVIKSAIPRKTHALRGYFVWKQKSLESINSEWRGNMKVKTKQSSCTLVEWNSFS